MTAPDDWWTRREDDEVRRSDDGSVEESGDAENTTKEAVQKANREAEEKCARMEEVVRILKRLSPEEAAMLMEELDCETWRRKAVRGTGGASARGCR